MDSARFPCAPTPGARKEGDAHAHPARSQPPPGAGRRPPPPGPPREANRRARPRLLSEGGRRPPPLRDPRLRLDPALRPRRRGTDEPPDPRAAAGRGGPRDPPAPREGVRLGGSPLVLGPGDLPGRDAGERGSVDRGGFAALLPGGRAAGRPGLLRGLAREGAEPEGGRRDR